MAKTKKNYGFPEEALGPWQKMEGDGGTMLYRVVDPKVEAEADRRIQKKVAPVFKEIKRLRKGRMSKIAIGRTHY